MKQLLTLIISLALFTSTLFSAAQPVKAFDIVHDPLNFVKNTITAIETHITSINSILQTQYLTVLNPLATIIARTQLMTQGFNWVRQMAQGIAPGATAGFVTNLAQNLQAVRNGAADSFIQQYLSNGSVTSSQRTLAQNALSDFNRCNNSFTNCHPDTLTQYTTNPDAARSGNWTDPSVGLQGVFGLLVAGNDNIHQDLDIRSGLSESVSGAQAVRQQELDWGQGFLAQHAPGCGAQSPAATPPTTLPGNTGSSPTSATLPIVSLNPVDNLINCAIQTPNSIIHDITNHFANAGSIAQSDTHNIGELLTTFLLHMVSQIATRGLAGASSPGSAGDSSTQTGLGATPGLDSSSGIGALIDQQTTNVTTFQNQWQQILNAAQTATATLTNNSACLIHLPDGTTTTGSEFLASTVTPTITHANAQLAKVDPSLAKLNEVKTAAGQGTANGASAAGQALSDLFSSSLSPFYPSISDLSYANAQSNSTDATSLISLLTSANTQCHVP